MHRSSGLAHEDLGILLRCNDVKKFPCKTVAFVLILIEILFKHLNCRFQITQTHRFFFSEYVVIQFLNALYFLASDLIFVFEISFIKPSTSIA